MGFDIALLLSVASAVIGVFSWYRSYVIREASRDHDYQFLRQCLEASTRDVEDIRSMLLELKAWLIAAGVAGNDEVR